LTGIEEQCGQYLRARYRFFIQRSAAIVFVPPNFVRVSWDGLKAEMPDNSKVQSYSDYFDKT